ncbi:sugar phosphate isomerase/epimerase [Erwiniaceae bacterium BAC15a-03b]|uniref:Sugar phosphate isomerase/epimerase n=1 Tax=Winslowiella arboricola TaxID=2978220 RepID=A0A9J6PRU8_9GAMM|nr:TIM barrel protein [Winslowiella arboricola]MCU5773229.1 sugar phosphate isomerase/epimerase [Winslowiella arboricola]MCU5779115.1 sugar phosphate isomerase/epimerase [Winslowiella arboricola]
MKLGLNLSFAIKRWLGGEQLAKVVSQDLAIDRVQFTWDLVDPWWPARERNAVAREYADAFRAAGITVESTFGGLASYCYNHLLAPSATLRDLGKEHLRRAIDMTAEMEVAATGMPLGSYSAQDALDVARREEIYQRALQSLVDVARYAKIRGLSTLLIEPVPLTTEFPSSAEDALRLMTDLDGETDVPVRLLVDWGHALFTPIFGEHANMEHWIAQCGDYIAAYHIQQTDGLLDRHWSFTQPGIVTPQRLSAFWRDNQLTDQTYLLEMIYPFEQTDAFVLQDMQQGIQLLKSAG